MMFIIIIIIIIIIINIILVNFFLLLLLLELKVVEFLAFSRTQPNDPPDWNDDHFGQ